MPRLRALLAQAGVDAPVRQRRVESGEAPSARVPRRRRPRRRPSASERTDYGLKCRRSDTADRLRGTPSDESFPSYPKARWQHREMMAAVFALVITGPPGAGKTEVIGALSDLLVAEDVRHATVEVEALTSAHPPLDDDHWTAPVRAVCERYRRFGYELLLITVTVESQGDLDATAAAIGADRHAVVRLEADPATLRERIAAREPKDWPGIDDLLGASARLGPVIAALDGIELALSTDSERPETIAERIRTAFPSALRPAQP